MISKKKKPSELAPLSMTIPEGYSLDRQGITQSLMSTFLQCPQKFVYAINRMSNAKKIGTTNFGSIVHHALECLYKSKESSLALIIGALNQYRVENKESLARIDAQKAERDFAVAEVMLTAYIRYYAEDWTEMKEREPEAEIEFSPLTSESHILGRCKIDGRYRDKAGKKWLIEHKTKGRISEETLVKRLSFDPQNLFYLLADYKATNEEAIGVLYNIIRNPQIKSKVNESLAQFCDRLSEDVKLRYEFYFLRYEIPYTKNDKNIFENHLRNIIISIDKLVKGENSVYRNSYSCDAPFECEYLDACSSNSFVGYFQRDKIFSELDCEY